MNAKEDILTLREVADMLNISVETVLNLLAQKQLKGIKIGNQWRFHKNDIEKWQKSQEIPNVERIALENVVGRFFAFINSDFIKIDLKAKSRFEVLAEMAQFARMNGVCRSTSWLYNMLVQREQLISTGIGNGIAFLHPRRVHPDKISFSAIFLGISKDGIGFRTLDRMPVNLFFLILMKSDQQHLFALSYLSQLFHNEGLKDKILAARDKKTILELLTLKKKPQSKTP
jgi:PTS system nitrogen regulatory IIA component